MMFYEVMTGSRIGQRVYPEGALRAALAAILVECMAGRRR